jgi:uncharacterized membrane protein (UPF0182 family)
VLIAGLYPAAIQNFQVKPSESSKEAPFIQRNIESTRAAYGLEDVSVTDYQATLSTSSGQLANDAATIANIRLMDPNVLSATFRQLQQIRPYYSFPESLDIDRYTVNGVKRDVVVAVRELNIQGNPSRNWINDHLVYTHGLVLLQHMEMSEMLMESHPLQLEIFHQLEPLESLNHVSILVKMFLTTQLLVE